LSNDINKGEYVISELYKSKETCDILKKATSCICDTTGISNYVVLYTDANLLDSNKARTIFEENKKIVLRNISEVNKPLEFVSIETTDRFYKMIYKLGNKQQIFFATKDGKYILAKCN